MPKTHKSNSLAEISTIFGMTLLLTLFGVFVYFMLTANQKSAEIKEQLSMDILFHENVDESTVKMMEKKLKSMEGIVKNALYVSKEDAQKIMMKHVGQDAFEILDDTDEMDSVDDASVINMDTDETPYEVNIEYVLIKDEGGAEVYRDQDYNP